MKDCNITPPDRLDLAVFVQRQLLAAVLRPLAARQPLVLLIKLTPPEMPDGGLTGFMETVVAHWKAALPLPFTLSIADRAESVPAGLAVSGRCIYGEANSVRWHPSGRPHIEVGLSLRCTSHTSIINPDTGGYVTPPKK